MLITSVWSKLQKHFLSIQDCGGNLHQAQPLYDSFRDVQFIKHIWVASEKEKPTIF
jgi:hypothetical protein